MGRWLEAVKGGPSDISRPYDYPESAVIAEIAPHALLCATDSLPSAGKRLFPLLQHIGDPHNYNDESLWLPPPEVESLKTELFTFAESSRGKISFRELTAEQCESIGPLVMTWMSLMSISIKSMSFSKLQWLKALGFISCGNIL